MGRYRLPGDGGRVGAPATQADPDSMLVQRARSGDPSATAELYQRHSRRAYNLALRMLGDPWDAADVSQEAFIKAFGALRDFKGEARFSTWFHRIVVNAVYDHLRRRRLDPLEEWEIDRLSSPATGRPGGILAAGARSAVDPVQDGLSEPVREALKALNEGFRLAVVLCDLLGFDYAEAAEILGVQEGTVKSRIFRARAQLARQLTESGYAPAEGAARKDRPGNHRSEGSVTPVHDPTDRHA